MPADLKVEEIFAECHGAYSVRTIDGYASDLRVFKSWCGARSNSWLPALPEAIAAFIDDQVKLHRISTIKRGLCAIAFAHRTRRFPALLYANMVGLAVRRAARQKASRPKQVRGLMAESGQRSPKPAQTPLRAFVTRP